MSDANKVTVRISPRIPPVFHVTAIEVSPHCEPEHIILRFEALAHVCMDFQLSDAMALELSGVIERQYQKRAGLPT